MLAKYKKRRRGPRAKRNPYMYLSRGKHHDDVTKDALMVTELGLDKITYMKSQRRHHYVIAQELGIAIRTWNKIRKRQPEIDEALAIGEALAEDELIEKLMDSALRGKSIGIQEAKQVQFALTHVHGFKEGTKRGEEKVQVGPIVAVQINLPGAMNAEQYENSIEARIVEPDEEG